MCPPRAGRSAFFPTCHEGPEKVHKYDVVCYGINMTLEERGAGVDSTGVPVIPVRVVAAPDQEDLAHAQVACLPVFLLLPITCASVKRRRQGRRCRLQELGRGGRWRGCRMIERESWCARERFRSRDTLCYW